MFRSSSTTRIVFTAARIPVAPAASGGPCKPRVRAATVHPMFATLLGGLPPPDLPSGTGPSGVLAARIAAQVEPRLEPVPDGAGAAEPTPEAVDAWQAASAGTELAVKAVL